MISPIDSRYKNLTAITDSIFCDEYYVALNIDLEIFWYIFLRQILSPIPIDTDERLYFKGFDYQDAYNEIKKIESEINHDIGAVERYVRTQLLPNQYPEYIHFGLTSQDVVSISRAVQVDEFLIDYNDLVVETIENLMSISGKLGDTKMIAYTHGQPGVPMLVKDFFDNYMIRLRDSIMDICESDQVVKFGGAVGKFTALKKILGVDSNKFDQDLRNRFYSEYGFIVNCEISSQVYWDNMSSNLMKIKNYNQILLDFTKNMWIYFHNGYFTLKGEVGEVGSSTMAQKINPIDFENAEGNLILCCGMLDTIANSIMESRLQRDLHDSTLMRNVGVAMAHMEIATRSILKGLSKTVIDYEKINQSLEENYQIYSENLQLHLKFHGDEAGYEKVKIATRGKKFNKSEFIELIKEFDIDPNLIIE